jgi:Secretion system C-terminal sorting domain
MNSLNTKYQLTGEASEEFAAYRSITDMMAQHYANGGNKYSLSSLQVEWLQDMADNSPYFRSRGMARRILRLYGYYYPVDYGTNSEERKTLPVTRAVPELFRVYPNPASQQITVHVEMGSIRNKRVLIRLLRTEGTIWEEKRGTVAGSGDFLFDVQTLPSGIYFLQLSMKSGEVQTKRISIVH